MILVQGHRGSRGTHPENTIAGFMAATIAGADFLELDLQGSKDHRVVIFHDFTEKKHGSFISQLTLDELKTVDCGSRVNPHFPKQRQIPGEKIPTLEELLEAILLLDHPNGKKIQLNLEIKRDPRHPEWSLEVNSFVDLVLSTVKKYNFENRVYYSSFDPESLAKIREKDGKAALGLIFDKTSLETLQTRNLQEAIEKILAFARNLKIKVISPSFPILKEIKSLQISIPKDFKIIPWTVNTPKDWDQCLAWGIDGIITDYPKDLIEFLAKN